MADIDRDWPSGVTEDDYHDSLRDVDRLRDRIATLESALRGFVEWYRTRQDGDAPNILDDVFIDARRALAGSTRAPTEEKEQDLTKCPRCGGPADNGNDRSVPPHPYYCRKCMDTLYNGPAEETPKPTCGECVVPAQNGGWCAIAAFYPKDGREDCERFEPRPKPKPRTCGECHQRIACHESDGSLAPACADFEPKPAEKEGGKG